MIVTVTCNPAIDITYRVDHCVPGEVHRVQQVHSRAGGKGVNVARVLHALGEAVVATGFADREFGEIVETLGIPAAFVAALPGVRRTVVVDTEETVTSFWEPGRPLTDPETATQALELRVVSLLVGASSLVVSGSLPPNADPGLPSRLARAARGADLPVILDLDAVPLQMAADGSAAVLTPNLDEVGHLVHSEDADLDIVAAGQELSLRSGAPIVVTLGPSGMVAVDGTAAWHAALGSHVPGNPTGAGDAATAAIAAGLSHGKSWPDCLVDAVALSASAVLAPVAGEVDLDAFRRWRSEVLVRRVDSYIVQRR